MKHEPSADSETQRETVTSTDGTTIAVERSGSGPPVVFVHGTGADRTSWSLIRPLLEDRITLYAVERRGRGRSGDTEPYAIEREFEDVAAVVESVGEPVSLVGHSYGGTCVLEAARRVDELASLVLYEPAFPVEGHALCTEEFLEEYEALLEAGERERALERFYSEVGELSPALIEALRSAPNWQPRVDAAHTVLRELRAEAGYEFDAARFEDVTAPTLLLTGSETLLYSKETTSIAADALPNSRVVTLDGQAHAAHLTAPELFAEELVRFVEESS
jgi:pimeloyl-ACP methyl ester carboxylesterase